jgi:hypothetical protein
MFERSIKPDEVVSVLRTGEIIEDYPDDKPYPSKLILGFIGQKPLHVVVAEDNQPSACNVVTVYIPDEVNWQGGYKIRRRS